jgi:hypothetical protein
VRTERETACVCARAVDVCMCEGFHGAFESWTNAGLHFFPWDSATSTPTPGLPNVTQFIPGAYVRGVS